MHKAKYSLRLMSAKKLSMYKYVRMCITDSRAEDVKESTTFTYLCINNETEPHLQLGSKTGHFPYINSVTTVACCDSLQSNAPGL